MSQETLTVGGISGDQPGKSIPVTFITPTYPEPEENGKYILIFQGTLGSEQGSVVGKVVNLENIWEDWEKGLTGRHPWSVGGYGGASTVVPGFEDNKTQVLKMESGYLSQLNVWLEKPLPKPQKISFDYYTKSFGSGYGDSFELGIGDWNSSGCYIQVTNPGNCGTPICRLVVRNQWVHVTADLSISCTASHLINKVDGVFLDLWHGSWYENVNKNEVYIDNIKFE